MHASNGWTKGEQATADAKRKLALQPIGSGARRFQCTRIYQRPCPQKKEVQSIRENGLKYL